MNNRVRLVLLSFLMLFVELSLIRWLGSDVFYLSYFSNFVLLGSFLGIGIGFLRANSRFALFSYAPLALAALVGFVLRFPVEIDRSGNDLIFFGGIVRCDLIADGVINAVKKVGVKVPVVVRLEGTNADKARAMLAKSGLKITPATDLTDAAHKVVALAVKGKA